MKILALRDPHQPSFFNIVHEHLLRYFPNVDTRSLFDPLPHNFSAFDLCVFWLLDPLDNRPEVYHRACAVSDRCKNLGIPFWQNPRALPNGRKSTFARLVTESRLPVRVARVHPITNVDEFFTDFYNLPFPLFVRDNDFHSVELVRADSPEQARELRTVIAEIRNPIAVEFIETAEDGLYRKFRCVVAGDRSTPLHVQVSADWVTRGEGRIYTREARDLEREYTHHMGVPVLNAVARTLGLDYGAFDYTYDQAGRIVVWEINPAPMLHFVKPCPEIAGEQIDQEYRNTATRRVLDMLVASMQDRGRK